MARRACQISSMNSTRCRWMALAIRLETLNDFSTELRAWLQFTVKQESEQERRRSTGKEGREPHERKGGELSENEQENP